MCERFGGKMPVDNIPTTHFPNSVLFTAFTPEQLQFVREHSRFRNYKTDMMVINQDDSGETLYIIAQGIVKVSMSRPDGREIFLAVLAKGDHFGELSLIDSQFRSANVLTQEATTLMLIDRQTFDTMLSTMPTFARNLCKSLANRARKGNERVGNLALMSVQGLVAHHILEFAELYGQTQPNDKDILIPIRLTQNDIADIVGASRERVNQVMKTFKDNGCISVNTQYRITVHNLNQLRRCIEMQ